MQTTVFVFHPHIEQSRVNRRLAREAAGVDGVTVRYLYELYPDGRIDVAAEQEALSHCERIVLQFPMYWYSSPSLLKQWQDDVLTYGWAYGLSGDALRGKALHGKELLIASSTGSPGSRYEHEGDFGYTVTELLRPFQATSNLIGTRFLKPFVTTGVLGIGEDELERQARAYAQCLASEDLQPLGQYE